MTTSAGSGQFSSVSSLLLKIRKFSTNVSCSSSGLNRRLSPPTVNVLGTASGPKTMLLENARRTLTVTVSGPASAELELCISTRGASLALQFGAA
eukprot:7195526-Alexandrium_andersonii.AAC.1